MANRNRPEVSDDVDPIFNHLAQYATSLRIVVRKWLDSGSVRVRSLAGMTNYYSTRPAEFNG